MSVGYVCETCPEPCLEPCLHWQRKDVERVILTYVSSYSQPCDALWLPEDPHVRRGNPPTTHRTKARL